MAASIGKVLSIDVQTNWGKWYASPNSDRLCDTKVDSQGNIYITGETNTSSILNGMTALNSRPTNTSSATNAFVMKCDSVGNPMWFYWLGGGSTDYAYRIYIDKDDSVYVLGETESEDFSLPGVGVKNPSNAYDGFIIQLSPSGIPIWGMWIQGENHDIVYNMTKDASGSIYIVGMSNSIEATYDENRIKLTSATGTGFIAKYNSDGTQIWKKTIIGDGKNKCVDICINNDNNILIIGTSNAEDCVLPGGTVRPSVTDRKGEWGTTAYEPITDAFLIKLNTNGDILHEKWIYGSGGDAPGGIYNSPDLNGISMIQPTTFTNPYLVVDPSNNIYICLNTDYYSIIGESYSRPTESPFPQGYLIKYNSNFMQQWSIWITDYPHTVINPTNPHAAITLNRIYYKDALYVAGWNNHDVIIPGGAQNTSGGRDFFIIRYDEYGMPYWSKSFGGSSEDYILSINVDSSNNIIVGGWSSSTTLFQLITGDATTNKPTNGSRDIFLLSYSQAEVYPTATLTGSTVSLSWPTPTGTSGITGYKIYKSVNNGADIEITSSAAISGTSATISNITTAGSYVFKVAAVTAAGTGPRTAILSPIVIDTVPCIPAGEMILTPTGWRAVETLRTGDHILTDTGRSVPVRMYSSVIPSTTANTAPIRIGYCWLSPMHAFKLKNGNWMFPKLALTWKIPSVYQDTLGKSVTYYHISLPNYFRDNLVLKGGITVESYGQPYIVKNGLRGQQLYFPTKSGDGFVRRDPRDRITHVSI